MQRKEFIKNSCLACAALAVGSTIATGLVGCAILPTEKFKNKSETVLIPLAKFKDSNVVIARVMWLDFDILAVKKEEDRFIALYMKCSHQDQPLSANKTGLFCTTHGSTFDLDGKVKKEPALIPLTQFLVIKTGDNIEITLPKNI